MSFLYLLYSRDVGSALGFFSWGGAYLWTGVRNGALRRAQLQWKRSRIERQLRRFEVIEGGRGDADTKGRRSARKEPNDWVN